MKSNQRHIRPNVRLFHVITGVDLPDWPGRPAGPMGPDSPGGPAVPGGPEGPGGPGIPTVLDPAGKNTSAHTSTTPQHWDCLCMFLSYSSPQR